MPRTVGILLTFTPLILVAYLYLGWHLHHALTYNFSWPPNQIRWFLLAVVGYLNLHPIFLLILHVSGLTKMAQSASETTRLWDILVGYPFWVGLVLVVEILPWLLAIDFIKLPFFPFYKKFSSTWLELQFRVTLALFLLYTVYVLGKVLIDTNRIRISKAMLTYRNLPFTLDGLRIVHISDIQADSRTGKRKIMRYVKKVNKLRPDVIFFTGDLVKSDLKFADIAARLLSNLTARYGTYACLGDHDLRTDAQEVIHCLRYNGISIRENSNQFVPLGKESLLVTFLTNAYGKRLSLDKVGFLMGQQPRGVLDILVMHQPTATIIELAAERGYHILLAGHTHGGQIHFRVFGLNLAAPRFESPYYRGTSHVERMLLSINNGLGLSIAPIRYNAPAEITLLKIIRRPG